MTTVALSASLSSLTTEVCKGDRTIRNKWAFLAEGYHSERITSLMLAKPEKGEKSPFEKLHKGVEKAGTGSNRLVRTSTKSGLILSIERKRRPTQRRPSLARQGQRRIGFRTT